MQDPYVNVVLGTPTENGRQLFKELLSKSYQAQRYTRLIGIVIHVYIYTYKYINMYIYIYT